MMNRIIVGLGVGLLFGLTQSTDAQQQKKALDINACMAWKRVDSPEISSTGRWVTYRVVSMEYNPEDKEAKTLHLFDSRTREEVLLPNVERLEFYNSDQAAYYQMADSAGNMKTMLMELPSGIRKEWVYKEAFRPVAGTPYSVSMTNVPKDTLNHIPSFDRLVIRHLKTGVAFHIDSIGYHSLYNQSQPLPVQP